MPSVQCDYVPTALYRAHAVDTYLADMGYAIGFDGLLEHCKSLAGAVREGSTYDGKPRAPLSQLLAALARAQQFVHFVSYGVSEFFFGALKLVAQRVPVRGVIANADERTLDEITLCKDDAPPHQFEVIHFMRGEPWDEFPHQKLVVVDGLLAFKGSANLTLSGWRKAARGRDHVDTVTKVNEVIDLHNKLFAGVWGTRKGSVRAIKMGDW